MDHNCASCGLKVPDCGRKRKVSEGFCNAWVSSKEISPDIPQRALSSVPRRFSQDDTSGVRDNLSLTQNKMEGSK